MGARTVLDLHILILLSVREHQRPARRRHADNLRRLGLCLLALGPRHAGVKRPNGPALPGLVARYSSLKSRVSKVMFERTSARYICTAGSHRVLHHSTSAAAQPSVVRAARPAPATRGVAGAAGLYVRRDGRPPCFVHCRPRSPLARARAASLCASRAMHAWWPHASRAHGHARTRAARAAAPRAACTVPHPPATAPMTAPAHF